MIKTWNIDRNSFYKTKKIFFFFTNNKERSHDAINCTAQWSESTPKGWIRNFRGTWMSKEKLNETSKEHFSLIEWRRKEQEEKFLYITLIKSIVISKSFSLVPWYICFIWIFNRYGNKLVEYDCILLLLLRSFFQLDS